MVGIFARFSGYMSKHHHSSLFQLDKKLGQVSGEDEEEGSDDARGDLEREGEGDDDGAEVGVDGEFEPIKHPLEPPDDDLPAKYPLPFSSVVNDDGELKESFTKGLQKIAESSMGNQIRLAEQTPTQIDRKRHQARDPSIIFQVFQQCKFEA